jgi:ACT domain-containing protein
MKNLNSNIQVLISLIGCLILFGSLYGQTPTPPTLPTPMMIADLSQDTHQVSVTVNSEYNHGGGHEGITKISSNQNYRYTSIFEKDLTAEIEAVLIQELGEASVVSENIKRWNHIDGKKVEDFQIMLRDGKVKITYKNGTQKVMKQLSKITKAICKITYQSNCD